MEPAETAAAAAQRDRHVRRRRGALSTQRHSRAKSPRVALSTPRPTNHHATSTLVTASTSIRLTMPSQVGECLVYSLYFQMSSWLSELMVTNCFQGRLESPLDANIYIEALHIFWLCDNRLLQSCLCIVLTSTLPRKTLGGDD